MTQEAIISYGLAGLAAMLPIGIWLYFLFKQGGTERKYVFGAFFGGILAVAIIMALQKFWEYYPQFDLFSLLTGEVEDEKTFFVIYFVIVGVLEEIAKQLLVRYLDTKKAVIRSINDSIRYSFIAALGFAFAENIFYFHSTFIAYGGFTQTLLITYIFRSIFTAAGHMCFSGIFGYFYGKGRFSSNLKAEAEIEGKKLYFSRFIARLFGTAESGILRKSYIIQGLTWSIVLHAIFNFILTTPKIFDITEQQASLVSMGLVAISFMYLYYLTKRKEGNIQLLTDVSQNKESTIDEKNEAVIIELLARWLKEKKYKDVIASADRLLKRDPNNATVQILKAKANDALEGSGNVVDQAIGSFDDGQKQRLEKKDKSVVELEESGGKKREVEENKVKIDNSEDDKFYHL